MKRPKIAPTTCRSIAERHGWGVAVHDVPSSEPVRTIVEAQNRPDMKRLKIAPTTCRSIAERHGWAAHDMPGSPEMLFAKHGRVFLATFEPPAALRSAHARLRDAGAAVYLPETAPEWAAILEYENRVAESAP